MSGTATAKALRWVLPSVGILVTAAAALACVLAYQHTAPIDARYRTSGPGVFQTRPSGVAAADELLGLVWIAALPVAVITTLLGVLTVDRLHPDGAARVLANLVAGIGVIGFVPGVVLALLGVLELLA